MCHVLDSPGKQGVSSNTRKFFLDIWNLKGSLNLRAFGRVIMTLLSESNKHGDGVFIFCCVLRMLK